MRGVRLLALLVALLVAGAVVLVLVERPELRDDRAAVDRRWTALRAPLQARYTKLAAAFDAFTFAGGADKSVAKDLRPALDRWDRLRRASDAASDTAAEASTANRLEGLGARLRADTLASDRLRAVTQLGDAITAYTGTTPPEAAVSAYDSAVERYEHARNTTLRKPVAFVFGYDERPVLVIVG
jgi:hypothetical protein